MLYITILFLGCFKANAQSGDPTRYFPIDEGNSWTYFLVLEPPGEPIDTIWSGPYSIDNSALISDTLYVIADYPFSLGDTLRMGAAGNIWARVRGRDRMLFDFSLADTASYEFESGLGLAYPYQVSINRNRVADVGAGHFENVIELGFDIPGVIDDEQAFAFAPGVGIVYAYGLGGDYRELYAAEVGGQAITGVEEGAQRPRGHTEASAFPNPFVSSVSIVLPPSGQARATVRVFDLLGRKVGTLLNGPCAGCTVTWNAEGLARGLYFARIERGTHSQTIKLILDR